MLEKFVMPKVEEEGHNVMQFQQDGASTQFNFAIHGFLNRKFPQKWIGRGDPNTSPFRFPSIASLESFFGSSLHK
jgi:hypothetical protein